MKKLLEIGNRYAEQSNWTDFALTKICLTSDVAKGIISMMEYFLLFTVIFRVKQPKYHAFYNVTKYEEVLLCPIYQRLRLLWEVTQIFQN